MHGTIDFLFHHGYSLLIAWVFAEQLGIPIPSIPILLAAGVLAGTGRLSLGTSLICVVFAAVTADLIWYQLGRRKGHRILNLLCKISLEPASCVRRTAGIYRKQGARSLLLAKFVPGLNTVSPPLAGIIKMRLRRFLLFDVIGTLVWASIFLGTGYLFSGQIERVAGQIAALGGSLVLLLSAGLAGYILYKYAARRRFIRQLRVARISVEELKRKLDDGESPVIVDLRDAFDFEAEPEIIPGALHMDASEFGDRSDLLPQGKEVILYCT
jgi:membrane protein DedA with SNARE-associated domain